MSLPFNPSLRERARELRKAGNLPEVLLWQRLHKNKFKNLDFDRQKIIGDYIVDFYCTNYNVVIEIDEISHKDGTWHDKVRGEYLKSLGLTVIHVTSYEILHQLDNIMHILENHPTFQSNHPGASRHPSKEGN